MIPSPFAHALSSLPAALAEPAARSIALGCLAGLALIALRVKGVSPRLAVWKIVLYSALAMPVLGWIVPALPFSVPAPWKASSSGETASVSAVITPLPPTDTGNNSARLSLAPKIVDAPAHRSLSRASEAAPAPGIWMQWKIAAGALYIAVATIFLARFLLGLLLSRRMERSARTVGDTRALGRLAFHAYAARLKRLPRLAESEIVLVPITLGVRQPAILLPATWRDWDDSELDAVMVHEVSHVVRRDALTQRLSLLHRAFFWFSPLSWWLDRRLAELAEEASDEAALSHGADRTRYAETLLNFFSQLESSSGRMRWQGVSMATPGTAERRVDRILAWKGAASSGLRKSLALGFALIAPPVVLLAAAVHPMLSYQESHSQPPPPPQVAPLPTVAPLPVVAPLPDVATLPRVVPMPDIATLPRVIPLPQDQESSNNYVYGENGGQSYAISFGKNFIYAGRHNFSIGSSDEGDEIHWLRSKISGDFIYVERDGKYYVIRDQATVKRAWDLFEPARALGEKQEELGKQQEALGEQQEALGEKMSEVKIKVPDMTAELEKVRQRLKELSAGGTQEDLGELQSEIGELQSRIGELQSEAGREQSKVGREQGELGRKQGELGRQQGEIGRQQGELSRKASREMKSLLDEAFSKGLAKPE
jgi:beta-lactamase regulating signal transducer with metallopeptidase domain